MIEDNPGDVILTMNALDGGWLDYNLNIAQNGAEAQALLHRARNFSGIPRPDLILLDLNVPKRSGRDLLAEIRSDEKLRDIPVAVISGSEAEQDIL
ncbi:MAG: response regulator, partial [Vicinamibacteria bacterium]